MDVAATRVVVLVQDIEVSLHRHILLDVALHLRGQRRADARGDRYLEHLARVLRDE